MTQTAPATRLHLDDRLATGGELVLDRDRTHLLRNVLRLAPGRRLALFNARDGEWAAEIVSLAKAGARLRVADQRRGPCAEPDIWLAAAAIKKARFDYLVEKATELGISRLLPVVMARGVVGRVKRARLQAQVREAAEQCERLSLPRVEEAQSLEALLAAWPRERRLLVCAERGAVEPLDQLLRRVADGGGRRPPCGLGSHDRTGGRLCRK